MSILDSLIIIVFSYWIKDLSLISLMKEKKKKKHCMYHSQWKNNREKSEK